MDVRSRGAEPLWMTPCGCTQQQIIKGSEGKLRVLAPINTLLGSLTTNTLPQPMMHVKVNWFS